MMSMRSYSINFSCQLSKTYYFLLRFLVPLVLILCYRDVEDDQIMGGQTINRKSLSINYVIFHIFGPPKNWEGGQIPTMPTQLLHTCVSYLVLLLIRSICHSWTSKSFVICKYRTRANISRGLYIF